MFSKMKEKMNECKKSNKGFTLMELIVVVAILGFLIAMLAPKYMNYTDKAMGTAAAADVRNIQSAASAYLLDNDAYPTLSELEGELGITKAGGGDKVITGAGPAYVYTYTKSGIGISAAINIDDSTAIFTLTGVGNNAKKDRVIAGIGSNHAVIGDPTP